jgi:carboxyl-terminal processing protease
MITLWKRAPRADRWLFVLSIFLLIASIFLIGARERQLQASSQEEEFYRFVDVAAEVYSEIRNKYVDEVDSRKVLESGLQGMFRALDEHSQYMNPDLLKSLEKDTSGEFSGIGIHITLRQGILTVIAPIPGSPAAEAGLQPWDRIIEIEGESTQGLTTQDAVQRLTGPAGTEVTFKVWREGEMEPLSFTIRRANVEIESIFHKMMDNKIGYVRIARFSENTTRDLRRAILELKSQDMAGLVIDLRYNSGGLLREAIDVSNLFLNKGELIVSTKGRLRQQNREYYGENDPLVRDLPLFVLVNDASASASEIVAGAIQDHQVGVIIGPAGKNTFGKGSVQTIGELIHSMSDDADGNPMSSAIRLTTARYYTPSGRTIHNVGITPDIGIPLPQDHEIELVRHGLLGEPFTGEEYRVKREEKPEGEQKEGLNGSPQLQTPVPNEAPEEEQPEAEDGKPFYMVQRPELVSDEDFVDVLLEEALKQMKIYMILERGNRGGNETIASRLIDGQKVVGAK